MILFLLLKNGFGFLVRKNRETAVSLFSRFFVCAISAFLRITGYAHRESGVLSDYWVFSSGLTQGVARVSAWATRAAPSTTARCFVIKLRCFFWGGGGGGCAILYAKNSFLYFSISRSFLGSYGERR